MRNEATAGKAAALSCVLLILFLVVTKSGLAVASLPQPQLVFAGKEDYEANGSQWTRYKLSVCNRSEYPDAMFESAPDLPPCGRITKSSRSWVDIYARDGERLFGFCALKSSEGLGTLWFSRRRGQAPPEFIYIVITDRKLNMLFKSNLASTDAR